jgi:FtsP/CotA-like multicopper oxidase with cupredoxin domain
MARPTRREFLQFGIGGATLALTSRRSSVGQELSPTSSPPTTPFVDPLPLPPVIRQVSPFSSSTWNDLIDPTQTRFFQMVVEEASVPFHRDLPPTRVWRFRDASVPLDQWPPIVAGPTFLARMVPHHSQGNLVRITNRLPANHVGFGHPHLTTHLHGTHAPALSDGFAEDTLFQGQPFKVVYSPGESFDYFYPQTDVGVGIAGHGSGVADVSERPSTLWYHDHLLDFTGPNNYRGLQGCYFVFDELDSGNERDPNPAALRLPSGPFDIMFIVQDKRFAADGSLMFDQFDFDGVLGDKFLVNGKIQPFLRVKRRKYRFRVLDGSNARFYQIFVTDSTGRTYPMTQIGRDSSLLSRPIAIESFLMANSNRIEVIVDFGDPRFDGVSEVFLENRLQQDEGRGPDGDFEEPELLERGVKLLKFILEERVEDPSRIPATLRPFQPISPEEIAQARVRRFEYERSGGLWVINGEVVDIHDPMASPRVDQPEIWQLINKSGGWWHPVHTHLEFGRVLRRNGRRPTLTERDGIAKVDAVILGPNSEVDVFFRFRDYSGPFVNHCHNLEHEDHAMMFRYDIVGDEQHAAFFRGRS